MRTLFRTALFVSAMVVAASALAQVTTRFDGTYAKVSGESSGGTPQTCPPAGAPQVVITGGIGHMIWGDSGVFSGWVDPHGMLTLQSTSGLHFDAQIKSDGVIQATVKLPACSYRMTWKKK
ncbi:MAG: hypothetical protein WB697_16475 [Stellaceae bacterium]